jgi:hypothetical protein
LVSVAVAVSSGNVGASTFVDLARSVADAARVESTDTVIHVVTNAVSVVVVIAHPSADAQGVQLVSVAVAVSSGDVSASAFVDVPRTVANAAIIEGSDAVVDVVAYPVAI